MNKARVEAFSDAIIAIIMTIMVLEFKTPESAEWSELLSELPYLFAYSISFLFIGVSWYNHHYMFTLAKRITKKIYWLNNLWLFSMSLLPIATGWAGKFINEHAPEYFYFGVFVFWSLCYFLLSHAIKAEHHGDEIARLISEMPVYRLIGGIWFWIASALTIAAIAIYPPSCLILTLVSLIIIAWKTSPDSDQLVTEE